MRRRSGLCRSAPSCLCLQGKLRGRRWIRRFLYAWLLAWDYEHENQRLFVALVPANARCTTLMACVMWEVWPAAVADKVADKEGEEPFVLLEIAARARSEERAPI